MKSSGIVKFLLDTNAYLRLAYPLHPLLKQIFGNNIKYKLFVHPELEKEYDKSSRLQTKFDWFLDEEFKLNRNTQISNLKQKQKEIEDTLDFFLDGCRELEYGNDISLVDVKCLVYSYVLNYTVVTDDINMCKLADEYEVKNISTLDLLKLMYDSKYINLDKINEIILYWKINKDYPTGFNNLKSLYKKYFKKKFPY